MPRDLLSYVLAYLLDPVAQVTYPQVLMEMLRAIFWFLLPGDMPSSRRLTDIMLAGCIPVFLGAPWHAMPFAGKLQYWHFALFFRLDAFLRNSSMWVPLFPLLHVLHCFPSPPAGALIETRFSPGHCRRKP